MSAQDLINWGELSRLLSDSRMNIRKNRIPKKYEADVQKLVSHIETWQWAYRVISGLDDGNQEIIADAMTMAEKYEKINPII